MVRIVKYFTILLILFTMGCFHSRIRPRTADLLPAGKASFGVTVDLAGIAKGVVELSDGTTDSGNSAQFIPASFVTGLIAFLINGVGFNVQYGLGDDTELSFLAGLRQSGLGIRQALTDEDRSSSISTAISVAGGWDLLSDGLWVRGGFDFSKRFGSVSPFLDLYLVWGVQDHVFNVTNPPRCEGFGQPGCGEGGPGAYYRIRRNELRIQAAIGTNFFVSDKFYDVGFSSRTDYSIGSWSVAAQPYFTIWAEAPKNLECSFCGESNPVGFFEDMGAFLTFTYSTWPPSAEPNFPD